MDRIEEGFVGKTILITGGAGALAETWSRHSIHWKTRRIIILDNLFIGWREYSQKSEDPVHPWGYPK